MFKNKIIKCSNLIDVNEDKIIEFIFILLTIVGIFFTIVHIDYINYICCIVIVLYCIYYIFFYTKIPEITLSTEELLNEYIKNLEEADNKYNNKYIKLISELLDINFIEKYMVFITLKKNEKYLLEGKIILPSNKCIRYLKKIKLIILKFMVKFSGMKIL